jgi:hypothetical protein
MLGATRRPVRLCRIGTARQASTIQPTEQAYNPAKDYGAAIFFITPAATRRSAPQPNAA